VTIVKPLFPRIKKSNKSSTLRTLIYFLWSSPPSLSAVPFPVYKSPTLSDGVVLPVHSPAAPLHRFPLRDRRRPPRRRHPPLLRQHRATGRAHARPRPVRPGPPAQEARQGSGPTMVLAPASSGSGSVIAEVEMNAGADQGAATVRATVVQASTVFYDTPATLDRCVL
jgi:hypothetical protein